MKNRKSKSRKSKGRRRQKNTQKQNSISVSSCNRNKNRAINLKLLILALIFLLYIFVWLSCSFIYRNYANKDSNNFLLNQDLKYESQKKDFIKNSLEKIDDSRLTRLIQNKDYEFPIKNQFRSLRFANALDCDRIDDKVLGNFSDDYRDTSGTINTIIYKDGIGKVWADWYEQNIIEGLYPFKSNSNSKAEYIKSISGICEIQLVIPENGTYFDDSFEQSLNEEDHNIYLVHISFGEHIIEYDNKEYVKPDKIQINYKEGYEYYNYYNPGIDRLTMDILVFKVDFDRIMGKGKVALSDLLSVSLSDPNGDIANLKDSVTFKHGFPLIDFLYFSAITITTTGYGDILPNSQAVRTVVMIESLLGVLLPGLFISTIFVKFDRA